MQPNDIWHLMTSDQMPLTRYQTHLDSVEVGAVTLEVELRTRRTTHSEWTPYTVIHQRCNWWNWCNRCNSSNHQSSQNWFLKFDLSTDQTNPWLKSSLDFALRLAYSTTPYYSPHMMRMHCSWNGFHQHEHNYPTSCCPSCWLPLEQSFLAHHKDSWYSDMGSATKTGPQNLMANHAQSSCLPIELAILDYYHHGFPLK